MCQILIPFNFYCSSEFWKQVDRISFIVSMFINLKFKAVLTHRFPPKNTQFMFLVIKGSKKFLPTAFISLSMKPTWVNCLLLAKRSPGIFSSWFQLNEIIWSLGTVLKTFSWIVRSLLPLKLIISSFCKPVKAWGWIFSIPLSINCKFSKFGAPEKAFA